MQSKNDTVMVVKMINVPASILEELSLPFFSLSGQVRLMMLRLNFDAFRLKLNGQSRAQGAIRLRVLNLIFDDNFNNQLGVAPTSKIDDISVVFLGKSFFSSLEAFSSVITDLGYTDLELPTDFWVPVQSVLSFREIEVLHHVYNGLSSKQIGDELNLSARTVELHRQNCGKKIGPLTPRALSTLFSSSAGDSYVEPV